MRYPPAVERLPLAAVRAHPATFHADFGDVPTWGLLTFAVVTAILAGLAFRKQAQEVRILKQSSDAQAKVLELQAVDLEASLKQRQEDAKRRRWDQAEHVFIWEERHDRDRMVAAGETWSGLEPRAEVTAHVTNTSDRPVYHVKMLWLVDATRAGEEPETRVLLPGKTISATHRIPQDFQPRGNWSFHGAVVSFTDASNVGWRAHPGGQLEELH